MVLSLQTLQAPLKCIPKNVYAKFANISRGSQIPQPSPPTKFLASWLRTSGQYQYKCQCQDYIALTTVLFMGLLVKTASVSASFIFYLNGAVPYPGRPLIQERSKCFKKYLANQMGQMKRGI